MKSEDTETREMAVEFLDEYGEEWEEPSYFHRKFDEFLKSKYKDLNAEILGKNILSA